MRRLEVIQEEICCTAFCKWVMLEWKFDGWNGRKSCVWSAWSAGDLKTETKWEYWLGCNAYMPTSSQIGIGSESHCLLGQLNKILEISDSEPSLKVYYCIIILNTHIAISSRCLQLSLVIFGWLVLLVPLYARCQSHNKELKHEDDCSIKSHRSLW